MGKFFRLRRLRLRGFKTFADPTVVELVAPVVALVGPNGSGKSNLVEAVRFALGETNPRKLRLGRWEEAVFAGGPGRAPAGLAEVEIVLADDDGDEVSFCRRVHRAGDHEYLVNGRPVRQRDYLDALADHGLGPDGPWLVVQGGADRWLNLRPVERRQLLEASAGLAFYRQELAEAADHLAAAAADLTRLKDRLAERRPRLEALARQAETFRTWRDLESRRVALLGAIRRTEWLERRRQVDQAEAALEAARQAVAAARQQLLELEGRARELQTRTEAAESRVRSAREALEAAEAGLGRAVRRQEELQDRLGRGRDRLGELGRALAAGAEERARLEAELSRAEAELNALDAELSAWEFRVRRFRAWAPRLAARAEAVTAAAARARRAADERAAWESRLRRAETDLLARLEAVRRALVDVRAGLLSPEDSPSEADLQQLAARLDQLRTAEAELNERVGALRAELGALKRRRQDLEAELNRQRSALKALESQSPEAADTRLLGRIRWPAELTAGLELVLGPAAEARVVTDVPADGLVPDQPLVVPRPGPLPGMPPPPPLAGVRGRLIDLIEAADADRPWLERLLGDVLVVDSPSVAWQVWREGLWPGRVVWVRGVLWQPDGLVLPAADGRAVQAEARRRALAAEVRRLEAELAGLAEAAARTEGGLAGLTARLEGVRAARQTAETELVRARARAEAVRAQRSRLGAERRRLLDELARLRRDLRKVQAELEALTGPDSSPDAVDLARRAARARDVAGRVRRALGAAEAQVRRLSEVRQAASARAERIRGRLRDLEMRQAGLLEARARLEAELAHLEAELGEVARQIPDLAAGVEARRQALSRARSEAEQLRQALDGLGRELAEARRRLEIQTRLAAGAGERVRTAREALAELTGRLSAEGFDPEELARADGPSEGDPAELGRELRRVEAELRRLGPVNPLAEAEYARERAEAEKLEAEIADAEAARAELLRNIRRLEAELDRRFRRMVREVSAGFDRMVRELFGGGSGRLVLTDSPADERSGLELVVRLPGRRIDGPGALSGGERTLVTLALVLAFLSLGPTPLCLLDEADAALDEARLVKFADLLGEFADRTQFLVVTHSRPTMERAGALFGLSITPEGTSRIFSLRLEDMPFS
jgi:chromosome segregation protein